MQINRYKSWGLTLIDISYVRYEDWLIFVRYLCLFRWKIGTLLHVHTCVYHNHPNCSTHSDYDIMATMWLIWHILGPYPTPSIRALTRKNMVQYKIYPMGKNELTLQSATCATPSICWRQMHITLFINEWYCTCIDNDKAYDAIWYD